MCDVYVDTDTIDNVSERSTLVSGRTLVAGVVARSTSRDVKLQCSFWDPFCPLWMPDNA